MLKHGDGLYEKGVDCILTLDSNLDFDLKSLMLQLLCYQHSPALISFSCWSILWSPLTLWIFHRSLLWAALPLIPIYWWFGFTITFAYFVLLIFIVLTSIFPSVMIRYCIVNCLHCWCSVPHFGLLTTDLRFPYEKRSSTFSNLHFSTFKCMCIFLELMQWLLPAVHF